MVKRDYFIRQITCLVALCVSIMGCTSTDPSLGVGQQQSSVAMPAPVDPNAPPVGVIAGADGTTTTISSAPNVQQSEITSLAPNTNLKHVYFAPVVGAPVANVQALSKRLSGAAQANGIKLETKGAPAIDHEIRGYFSALSESGSTTVTHVWDVFAPNGERVYRIKGEEKNAGTSADPWSAVPPSAMEKIADSVLSQYAAWRATL